MEKDHLEILLEDIRGKFDLVLEGHDTLHKEIRDTREELCEKINLVDFKVETLNQKVDGVRDDLTRKVDGVRDDLTRKIDGVRDDLNQKIDGVESRLSNEIRATNQKIDSVEVRLSEKIDAVAADLSAHRADTESHRTSYRISESRD
jgi:archaellum component FlaC